MSVYSNLVIADGASNFWRLNEPSGTTAVDVIGGKNGTISGGVTLNQQGALSDGDKAMGFDGTTGKVATAAGVIALGTGSVTVEAWCKSSAALTQRFVVDGALEANLNFPGVLIRAMTVPSLNVLALKGDGTTAVEVAWGTPWTDGAWRHIVGVVSRGAPDQLLLYGNGALIASLPFPTAGWNLTSAQPWCIGNSVASGLPWGGLLDDVAIYPVALTPAQIAAHYTVGKIGKTAPTTYADRVILDGASNFWRLNEPSGTTAVDIVGGKNGTISGGVTLNQPGALSDGDPAMAFNGTTGKIQTVASVLIPLIVSIELWFKVSATGERDLFSTRGLSTGSTVVCYIDATTSVLGFFSDQGGGGFRVVRDGQWHHAVYVLDGVNCAVYTDGTLDRQSASTRATPSTGPAAFGWDQLNPQFWNGQLDDVAIYPVALSPAQIAAHYTVGKIGKTAPTTYADRVILDGASNYWRLNEPSGTTAVDVIGGKNGTISGGVTLNQPGALSDGDPAMAFNGTTGKVVSAVNVNVPGIATIEAWLKTSSTTQRPYFSLRPQADAGQVFLFTQSPGVVSAYRGIEILSGTHNVADGQWHHVVIVFNNGSTIGYVDGVVDITGTMSNATLVGSQPARIGFDQVDSSFWVGSLDDVAIYPVALSPAQIAAHYQARLLSGSRRPLPAFVLAHRRFPS